LNPTYVAEAKVRQIQDSLERLGPGTSPVKPLIEPLLTWNYRNRVTYHRTTTGEQGYVSWKDHRVIDVVQCPIANDELNQLWLQVRKVLSNVSAETVPYVVLRRSSTGEKALILSLVSPSNSTMEELQKTTSSLSPLVSVHATLIQAGSRTPFGKEVLCWHGNRTVTEELDTVRYSVRPDLFFQIHPEMTLRLVRDVLKWFSDRSVKSVLDIYCGAGLFSLQAAKNGVDTYGIEVRYEAIQAAQKSAKENHLTGVEFRAGKAERILVRLLQEGKKFDTAIVDPPRKGLHPDLAKSIPTIGIRHLLYISCSPPTLARDAKLLSSLGYDLEWVQPYDMFPQTYHVEMIASFVRK